MGMLRSGARALSGVVCLGVIVTVGSAHAEDDWRLGADLRMLELRPLLSLGGLGQQTFIVAPAATAALEFRASDHWRLFARFGGSVSDSDTSSAWSVNGSFGARYVLAPDDDARFSVHASAYAFRTSAETDGEDGGLAIDGYGFGVAMGVAVDLALTDELELRISLDLLSLGVLDQQILGLDEPITSTSFQGSLDMTPSLGLGISF